MTDEQQRQFYELCQAYRHTPVTEFVAVREAYDALVAFVNQFAEKAWKYDGLNK